MLFPVGRGHEHLDVLADDLGLRIPEQPFRGRVHRFDGPQLINGDDGVDGRVQDRPCSRLAFEQRLLGRGPR